MEASGTRETGSELTSAQRAEFWESSTQSWALWGGCGDDTLRVRKTRSSHQPLHINSHSWELLRRLLWEVMLSDLRSQEFSHWVQMTMVWGSPDWQGPNKREASWRREHPTLGLRECPQTDFKSHDQHAVNVNMVCKKTRRSGCEQDITDTTSQSSDTEIMRQCKITTSNKRE